MAENLLTLGGRTFRPAEGQAVTFRQHQYLMLHAARARVQQDVAGDEEFLARVLESGSASDLLAGVYVEVVGGAPEPWSAERAAAHARFFDAVAGGPECLALTAALTGVLLPFFPRSGRSSPTSPSSSRKAATKRPQSASAAARSTSGRGSRSSSRSRGRRTT